MRWGRLGRNPTCAVVAGCLLFAGSPATGQPASSPVTGVFADTLIVPATLSAPFDTLLLGEPFDARVTFNAPEPVAKIILLTGPEELDPVEVVETERLLDANGTVVQRVRLRAFAVGRVGIPPLAFGGVTDANVLVLTETSADTVTIASLVPEDAEGLLDLHDPIPMPGRRAAWWWWGGGAIAAIVGAAIVWWWRHRRRVVSRRAVPLAPAHETALAELAVLASDPRSRSGPWKPFYTDVTDVLRRYAWRRFGIPAPDLTTTETVRALRATGIDDGIVDDLQTVLVDADAIKFAKREPGMDAVSRHLATAAEFVRGTVPPPPAVDERGEAA